MRVIREIGDPGCRDSACPAFIEFSDPEQVGVRGVELADAEALADLREGTAENEVIIVIPRAVAEAWKASGR
jgi:hypothetical protein